MVLLWVVQHAGQHVTSIADPAEGATSQGGERGVEEATHRIERNEMKS
jgi:hypothetical protein